MKRIAFIMALFLCVLCGAQVYAQDSGQESADKTALMAAYQAENWEIVAQIASGLLVNEPENTDLLKMMARVHIQKDEYDKAAEYMRKLRTLEPDNPEHLQNLCAIESNIAGSDAANTCYAAVQKVTDNAQLYGITAQELEKAGRTSEARIMYEKAFALDPQNIVYLTGMTAIDFDAGNNMLALDATEKAIEGGLQHAILYLNAITAANRSGRHEKAIAFADAGYALYHDSLMLTGKAEALMALKRYAEAEALWKELDGEAAHNSIVAGRQQLGMTISKFALSCTSEQYKTCGTPSAHDCCRHEAEVLKYAEAMQDNDAAKGRDPMLAAYLGMAQILANRLGDAETSFAKVRQVSKGNVWTQSALAVCLYHSSEERDRASAVKLIQQLMPLCDNDVECLHGHVVWPPRLEEDLHAMIAAAQNDGKGKKGCGCSVLEESPSAPAAPASLLAILALAAIALRRRNA